MGKRATEELGYQVQYAQKEENVHIGRLCEVLERIFSHGLKFRKSHSALWNFLLEFKKYSPPEATSEIIENDQHDGYLTSMAKRLAGLDYKRDITPPARSPMADMNQIMKMKSITTDIGRARAWIRLSIEKRLLSHHLRYDYGFLRNTTQSYDFSQNFFTLKNFGNQMIWSHSHAFRTILSY